MLLLRLPLDLTLCFSHSKKNVEIGHFQTLASWYTLSLKPKGKGDGKKFVHFSSVLMMSWIKFVFFNRLN